MTAKKTNTPWLETAITAALLYAVATQADAQTGVGNGVDVPDRPVHALRTGQSIDLSQIDPNPAVARRQQVTAFRGSAAPAIGGRGEGSQGEKGFDAEGMKIRSGGKPPVATDLDACMEFEDFDVSLDSLPPRPPMPG